jgi:hypothetical protein
MGMEGSIEAEWSPGIECTQALEAGMVYDQVAG